MPLERDSEQTCRERRSIPFAERDRILQLHKQGYSPHAISWAMRLDRRKVVSIVSDYKRKQEKQRREDYIASMLDSEER